MQKGPYLLHARGGGGKLSRVPAEKTLLSRDPVVNVQGVHAAMGADGTVYGSYGTTLSKSTDGGRSRTQPLPVRLLRRLSFLETQSQRLLS